MKPDSEFKEVEIQPPEGMTPEELQRILDHFVQTNAKRNERARYRRKLRKEGKLPSKGYGGWTWILPDTRAHNLLYQLSKGLVPLTYISPLDGIQFLRLLKWDLISLDTTLDGYVGLTAKGTEVLETLGQNITATVYEEAQV